MLLKQKKVMELVMHTRIFHLSEKKNNEKKKTFSIMKNLFMHDVLFSYHAEWLNEKYFAF